MNIQAMMKQAQKLQKEMMEEKLKIDETVFEGTSSIVKVQVTGAKKIVNVKITDKIDNDDIDMLEDMIVTAINDAMQKIDKEMEQRMGKYTQGMPGMF